MTPELILAQAAASRQLHIVVKDSASGEAIRGARIEWLGAPGFAALSDSRGRALIDVVEGDSVVIRVSRLGFRTLRAARSLASVDSLPWTFELARLAAPTLPTVAVTDSAPHYSPRLTDFEHRRTSGRNGTFITRALIEKRNPVRMVEIFRGIPSVQIIDSAGVKLVASSRGMKQSSSRPAQMQMVPCVLRVAVDGLLMENGFSVDQLNPMEVHGIEVYAGPAGVPPNFSALGRDSYCGLIAFWTRDR